MFTIDLSLLMDEDEIEDALKNYCVDPTPERKLRVLSEIAHYISGMTDAEIDISGIPVESSGEEVEIFFVEDEEEEEAD